VHLRDLRGASVTEAPLDDLENSPTRIAPRLVQGSSPLPEALDDFAPSGLAAEQEQLKVRALKAQSPAHYMLRRVTAADRRYELGMDGRSRDDYLRRRRVRYRRVERSYKVAVRLYVRSHSYAEARDALGTGITGLDHAGAHEAAERLRTYGVKLLLRAAETDEQDIEHASRGAIARASATSVEDFSVRRYGPRVPELPSPDADR
jgi:hypothetical protein